MEVSADTPKDRTQKTSFEIPLCRARLIKTIFIILIFIIIGVWLVVEKPAIWKFPSEGTFFMGTFVTFGSTLLFLMSLVRIIDTRPALVLDHDGLTDRTNAMGVGRVRWADVRALRWMRVNPHKKFNWQRGGRVLAIDVVDPEKYLRQASPIARWLMMKPWASKFGTPVFVHLWALKIHPERLEFLVEQFSGLTSEHQEHLVVTL